MDKNLDIAEKSGNMITTHSMTNYASNFWCFIEVKCPYMNKNEINE